MPFLAGLLGQITVVQLIAALPQIIKAVQAAYELYQTLAQNHSHEASLSQATESGSKAMISILAPVAGVSIPIPHKMTDEEEEWFFKRVTGNQGY